MTTKVTSVRGNVSLLKLQFCLEQPSAFHRKKHLSVNYVMYLIDLHLCFPQLPFITLHVTFQLQVVVLKAAD